MTSSLARYLKTGTATLPSSNQSARFPRPVPALPPQGPSLMERAAPFGGAAVNMGVDAAFGSDDGATWQESMARSLAPALKAGAGGDGSWLGVLQALASSGAQAYSNNLKRDRRAEQLRETLSTDPEDRIVRLAEELVRQGMALK